MEFKNLISVDGVRVDLTDTDYTPINWVDCDADLVKNIERKINAIAPNSPEDVNMLIDFYVDYYAKGLAQISRLQKSNPMLFDEFKKISNNQEKQMQI